jgi:hypothetical protein
MYQYTVVLNANVGVLLGVTALNLDASNVTATFGTNGVNMTVTINGTTQILTSIGDAQSPTAFTYVSGGTTYLLSNGPVTPNNIADVTVGNLTALIGGLGDTGVTNGATTYVACYLAGTLILTEFGERPVEDLAIGDMVMTASGVLRPVKWIGTRRYNGAFARSNPKLLPVCLRRGALADGVPKRDLYISPAHAMLIDGALYPAQVLINGTSITQVRTMEEIRYFHVELDTHDVLIAEGAASESFVDDHSRGMFQNLAEYRALYPDAVAVPAAYCAPRIEDGYQADSMAHRLALRGALLQLDGTAVSSGPLAGAFDRLTPTSISGWARNPADPDGVVALTILDNDVAIADVLADEHRADLQVAGFGLGLHGFTLAIPPGLSRSNRHVISIRRTVDGQELPGSPMVLEAAYRSAA